MLCLILYPFVTGAARGRETVSARQMPGYQILVPVSCNTLEDSSAPAGIRKEYTLYPVQMQEGENYLLFYQVHHYVEIYQNENLIYRLTPDQKTHLCNSPGCSWVIIPLQPEDIQEEFRVVLTPAYREVIDRTPEFLTGSRYAVFTKQIREDLPDILLSMLVLIAGAIFITIALFCLLFRLYANNLLYLGLFSLCIGVWKFTVMRSASILFPKYPFLLSKLSLIMLPEGAVCFGMFIRYQIGHNRYRFTNTATTLCCIAAILQLLLQLTGITDLRESLPVSHVLIILTAIATAFTSASEYKNKKGGLRIRITLLCFLLCVIGLASDILLYYLTGTSNNILSTLAVFLVYIIIMGIMSILEMNHQAKTDFSTGLYNRNQCNELLQNEDVIREQTCLMIFDLNGLKKVNDTFGHEAGNTLIRCFAKLLQQQMPEQAFLGRYGGDEFIAIIKNCDRSMVCGLLAKIADAAKQYNQTPGANIPLTYAAGYALSDECPGCTMAVLLEKADFDMYQNKRAFYNALS